MEHILQLFFEQLVDEGQYMFLIIFIQQPFEQSVGDRIFVVVCGQHLSSCDFCVWQP